MGADISGIGTNQIMIQGKDSLNKTSQGYYRIVLKRVPICLL